MTVPFFCVYDHLKSFITEGRKPDPSIPPNACGYCRKTLANASELEEDKDERVNEVIQLILKSEEYKKQIGKKSWQKLRNKAWKDYLDKERKISASQAWYYCETHGLDIEDIKDVIESKGFSVDEDGFKLFKQAWSILNKQKSK